MIAIVNAKEPPPKASAWNDTTAPDGTPAGIVKRSELRLTWPVSSALSEFSVRVSHTEPVSVAASTPRGYSCTRWM